MEITFQDAQELRRLEESLWREEVRFSMVEMESILAPDFFEFGRSSRVYTRVDTLAVPAQEIDAVLPLSDFKARLLDTNVAQVTYKSVVRYPAGDEQALRSSIWTRSGGKWALRFHQGTPIPDPRED